MKYWISSILLMWIAGSVCAQQVAIGQWRDHLPYRNIKLICETADRVYASSESGLMAYDLSEQSVQRISTINGLSDITVTALGSSPDGKVLFVGYENGGIDLVKGTEIVYKADVVRADILSDRKINHFMFHDNLCFISTGFGILAFDYKEGDVVNAETKETFLIGEEGDYVFVNSTHILNDTLYAATTEGLYYAPYNNELYLPSSWKKDTTLPKPNIAYDIVSSIGNELLLNQPVFEYRMDTLYSKISGQWSINTTRLGEDNRSIIRYDDRVIFASTTSMEMYDSSWTLLRKAFTWGGGGLDPNICVLGKDDVVWIGDRRVGMVKSLGEQENDVINLEGPASNRSFNVFVFGDRHFVTGGGHTTNGFTFKLSGELSFEENEDWTIYTSYTSPLMQGIRDLTSVTVDPNNEKIFYASSLNQGLIRFEDDLATLVLPCDGDTLDTITGGICYVSDVSYDSDGNLWFASGELNEPLQVFTTTGKHLKFPILLEGETFNTGRLFHMSWGHIWIVTPKAGVIIYDYNGTLEDTTDDQYIVRNSGASTGNLPDNEVYCAAEDQDGHVWVGTRVGMRVFYNGRNAFNTSDFNAQDVFIQEGIYTQILMENENVGWIAVDGANKKWIATRGSGAFYLSADGSQELAHFTVENSPIYSDYINNLAIDGKTGEVFFATDQGLIGYRSDATDGNTSYNNVQAFPNPVASDYTGSIGISGLMANSEIRITDVAGNLVIKGVSDGGSFSWDGRNYDGNRVFTGVYLVFASNEDGSQRMVTKILFLN